VLAISASVVRRFRCVMLAITLLTFRGEARFANDSLRQPDALRELRRPELRQSLELVPTEHCVGLCELRRAIERITAKARARSAYGMHPTLLVSRTMSS
jgi:hypothetical protein